MSSAAMLMGVALLFMHASWSTSIGIIVAMIVVFAVSLITRQESMLYVPCVMPGMQKPSDNPPGMRSPKERDMEFEDVYLKTSDGLSLHCWFMPAPEAARRTAPTVLFLHANAGNIGMRLPNFAELVTRVQANVLALDYRGYGNSAGSPSEEGLIEDASTAWRWLRLAASEGRIDGARIFVFGRSLGGAVAIALARALQQAAEPPAPCGIIMENTFSSISDLVDTLFPVVAFDSLKERFLRVKWESIQRIVDVEAPLLFLTGKKDEMIPPSHSQSLHDSAKKSVLRRIELFEEGMHNDTWEKGGERYWEVWGAFIKDCSALADSSFGGCATPLGSSTE